MLVNSGHNVTDDIKMVFSAFKVPWYHSSLWCRSQPIHHFWWHMVLSDHRSTEVLFLPGNHKSTKAYYINIHFGLYAILKCEIICIVPHNRTRNQPLECKVQQQLVHQMGLQLHWPQWWDGRYGHMWRNPSLVFQQEYRCPSSTSWHSPKNRNRNKYSWAWWADVVWSKHWWKKHSHTVLK